MKKEITEVIYQDQRVAEEFCNFKCDYCEGFYPSEYNLATDKNGNLKLPQNWYSNMHNYTNNVTKHFDKKRNLESFYEIFLDTLEKPFQKKMHHLHTIYSNYISHFLIW